MKILFLLFLFINSIAQDNYSFRVAYGKVTASDLGEVLIGDWQKHPNDLRVLALDGGYLLSKNSFNLPIDIYAKVGFAYFDEDSIHNDIYEGTLYLKGYYHFLYESLRLGVAEGLSLTSNKLLCESMEAKLKNDHSSKFLNYLDISLDFNLGAIFNQKYFKGTYLGYAIKHRSGVFGLIHNVSHGGSNYNTLYIESNF